MRQVSAEKQHSESMGYVAEEVIRSILQLFWKLNFEKVFVRKQNYVLRIFIIYQNGVPQLLNYFSAVKSSAKFLFNCL